MKPRCLGAAANERDRWMVSYVDVLTLLLIFCLIAAARNQIVPNPTAPVHTQAPVARPPARTTPEDLNRVEQRLREHGLEPQLEGRGLVISLPQTVLFPPGEDRVSAEALPTIARIAEDLRDIPNHVVVVGHADTVPIHNRRFASNWDLSMARSRNVLKLLSSSYGVAETRLSISSYGPYRPTAPNDTAEGRAWNRRVEIVIQDEPDAQGPK